MKEQRVLNCSKLMQEVGIGAELTAILSSGSWFSVVLVCILWKMLGQGQVRSRALKNLVETAINVSLKIWNKPNE